MLKFNHVKRHADIEFWHVNFNDVYDYIADFKKLFVKIQKYCYYFICCTTNSLVVLHHVFWEEFLREGPSSMMSENKNHHIVKLSKDVFTRNHINDLKNTVNDLISQNIHNIFLDFSAVENIDQIGFGVLLSIQQIAVRHQIDIKLFGLNQNIKYIIEKAFNSAVFDIFDREEEAKTRFCNEGALIA